MVLWAYYARETSLHNTHDFFLGLDYSLIKGNLASTQPSMSPSR